MVQMTTQQLQELLRQSAKEGAELALSRANGSGNSNDGVVCNFCHRPGHTKDQCLSSQAAHHNVMSWVTCLN